MCLSLDVNEGSIGIIGRNPFPLEEMFRVRIVTQRSQFMCQGICCRCLTDSVRSLRRASVSKTDYHSVVNNQCALQFRIELNCQANSIQDNSRSWYNKTIQCWGSNSNCWNCNSSAKPRRPSYWLSARAERPPRPPIGSNSSHVTSWRPRWKAAAQNIDLFDHINTSTPDDHSTVYHCPIWFSSSIPTFPNRLR
jgi:hypothetical protein